VSFSGSTASGGAFFLIQVNAMAYGKFWPEIDKTVQAAISEAVLPLQQTIDRLRKDVEDLKRERGQPPEQAAQSKEEITR
jgi:hypothetical protein